MSESKTHELKTWPLYFEAVDRGDKNFELRKNDRGFSVDDVLHLREWQPISFGSGGYTGRECFRRVIYILGDTNGVGGLDEDFVILALSEAYLRNVCRECKQEFWHSQKIDFCSEVCWRKGMEKAYDAHQ